MQHWTNLHNCMIRRPFAVALVIDGSFNRDGGCGGGGGGCGHGGGRFANFQCQVCYKYGHTASVCHYRLTRVINWIFHSHYMILQIKEMFRPSPLVKISIFKETLITLVRITMDKTMVSDHQIHGIKELIRMRQCWTTKVNNLQVQWLQTPIFSLVLYNLDTRFRCLLSCDRRITRTFSNSVLLKVQTKSILAMDMACLLIPLVLPLLPLLLVLKCLYPWISFYMCLL